MSEHSQPVGSLPEKQNQPINQPAGETEQADGQTVGADISGRPRDEPKIPTLSAQVTRLKDSGLRTVQRQSMAAHIGSVQGNHHLQKVIARLQESEQATAPEQITENIQAGKIQRTLSAQPVIQRQGGGSKDPTVKFGKMTIAPGGLAPGKPRTPEIVFRGDVLTFSATTSNIAPGEVDTGVDGRIVGENSPKPIIKWTGNVITWQVTIGNMGVPANPGEAPQNVDARPYMSFHAPSSNAGLRIEEPHSFKVIADLQWLADRADIAGQQMEAAYLGGVKILKSAYGPYKMAFDAHKHSLDNAAAHDKLRDDILIGIIFAGIGGAAGGSVQALIRGDAKDLGTQAVATAVGDITKYVTRLGSNVTGGGGSTGKGHGSDTPGANPAAVSGSARGGVGFDPNLWIADREAAYAEEGKKAKMACVDLKMKLSEAWAAGKTDLMDQDPVDIIAPHVKGLQEPLPVLTQEAYATDLWRNWLSNFGFVIVPMGGGGGMHGYQMQERTWVDILSKDIQAQTGSNTLVKEVRESQQAKADLMHHQWRKANNPYYKGTNPADSRD